MLPPRSILLSVYLLLISGCTQEEPVNTPKPIKAPKPVEIITSEDTMYDGTYRLKSLNSHPYAGPEVTLTVQGKKIHGKAPINRFNGSLTKGAIGQLTATTMAGDSEHLQLETQFLKLLEESKLDFTNDGNLVARKAGIAHLTFMKSDTTP